MINIKKCEAIYTGGGIWVFIGELENGKSFISDSLEKDYVAILKNHYTVEDWENDDSGDWIWSVEKWIEETDAKKAYLDIVTFCNNDEPFCNSWMEREIRIISEEINQ